MGGGEGTGRLRGKGTGQRQERDPEPAADAGQHDRRDEELRQHVRRGRSDGHAQPISRVRSVTDTSTA